MGKVSKIKNDWLSELEAWEEREKDEDIRRMARVIRELADSIKTCRTMIHQPQVSLSYVDAIWNNLSDDAKELLE